MSESTWQPAPPGRQELWERTWGGRGTRARPEPEGSAVAVAAGLGAGPLLEALCAPWSRLGALPAALRTALASHSISRRYHHVDRYELRDQELPAAAP